MLISRRSARQLGRIFLSLLAVLSALTLSAAAAPAAEETVSLAGLTVTVWPPERTEGGKAPLILFSHGYNGCAAQSGFLMSAFARAGYAVFAPSHRDNLCVAGTKAPPPEAPFGKPEMWSEATYRDRADDLRHLLAALETDARWRDRLDFTELALAGHSLGGFTVLGLAGAWPGWKLPDVKAVLAFAAYSRPFLWYRALERLSVPVMYQAGALDRMTAALSAPLGAYDQTPAPKYYVEFKGADHSAWSINGAAFRRTIAAYSLAFLDHYVKGAPADPLLTEKADRVATLRYQSELGVGE
ncbi:MAG TPA: alpha/beta fold hydrolase [Alphaproteobacteria bacterium]|nr:alpha/beta fold hydrolase [Alphaproteobacteria bacterium]